MKRRVLAIFLSLAMIILTLPIAAFASAPATSDNPADREDACSSFTAGKQATVDGSTMTGDTCDTGSGDTRLIIVPAANHKPGSFVSMDYPGITQVYEESRTSVIPEVAHTYKIFSIDCPFGNENQVYSGENTCGTNPALETLNHADALLDWHALLYLGMARSTTAREFVTIVGGLIEQYGMLGSGEDFMISDPNEAWVMEIPNYSTNWVAQRIPDNAVSIHANRMRIQEVDPNDTNNYLMSPNLIQNAIDKGFYNPATDGPFNFQKVYNSPSASTALGNIRREWQMTSSLCPSQHWDPNGGPLSCNQYPLYVVPEQKISVEWWANTLWRNYYQGTPYDKSVGLPAGPFGSPERQSIKGASFERSICTPNSEYTTITQSRSWLPNSIGGVAWFTTDNALSSIYVPIYAGTNSVPESWTVGYPKGGYNKDSAFWAFQALDSFSQLRFSDMHSDVRAVFDQIEDSELKNQAAVEQQALTYYTKENQKRAEIYLTNYSTSCASTAEQAARDMLGFLIGKYVDGTPQATVSQAWIDLYKPYAPTWVSPVYP